MSRHAVIELPRRKPGRKPGTAKTGGRRRGTKNRFRKRDLLVRIEVLEKAVADLTKKGWTFVEVGETVFEPPGVGFFDVKARQCRWPLTAIIPLSDFRFCGQPCAGESAWCADHALVATKEA